MMGVETAPEVKEALVVKAALTDVTVSAPPVKKLTGPLILEANFGTAFPELVSVAEPVPVSNRLPALIPVAAFWVIAPDDEMATTPVEPVDNAPTVTVPPEFSISMFPPVELMLAPVFIKNCGVVRSRDKAAADRDRGSSAKDDGMAGLQGQAMGACGINNHAGGKVNVVFGLQRHVSHHQLVAEIERVDE